MAGIKKSGHRNAARSRHMIKQAFGELLHEKDLHKITVTDIVERANISRGTFYAHYLDVYDLYNAIQNNIMETMDKAIGEVGIETIIKDPTAAVMAGMEFLAENKTYYALFAGSNQGETFVGRIISYVENRCAPVVDALFTGESNTRVKLFLLYTLGAYENVILRWFSGELDLSAEDCAKLLTEFYLASCPEEIRALS